MCIVSNELRRRLYLLKDRLEDIYADDKKRAWLNKDANKSRCSSVISAPNIVIGQTRNKYKLKSSYFKVVTMVEPESTFAIYIRDPRESTNKPQWLKDLYFEHLCPLIWDIDPEWTGQANEFVVQVSFIEAGKAHFVNRHVDKHDIMWQYGIVLGEYKGGELRTCLQSDPTRVCKIKGKNYIVKIDGRCPHWVTPVTDGLRMSLYYFKMHDSRMNKAANIMFPPVIVQEMGEMVAVPKIVMD